jgi:tetratricopeptide (TPR) repeat protein
MSIDSTAARRLTPPQEVNPEQSFVPRILPWLVAAGALGVYLITLNHWVSLSSLSIVASVSGWNWVPPTTEPLLWLVTFPFRWLPPTVIPAALNLLSAVCAAWTLGLLARSVALLPHDRTEEQRSREKSAFALLSIRAAWVPPVLAALICGLQLTFWEDATAISGEMLNLLLFAYVIRCVLEYRLNEQDSWLFRAAVVYGAGMANNWGMLGFFPPFVVALIWTKRLGFFDTRFLGRLCLLGLVGLAFYLLLPIAAAWSKSADVSFWQALGSNLRGEKNAVFYVVFSKMRLLRGFDGSGSHPLWVLGLSSLLPLLALSVRWPSYFGDPSRLGVALATFIIHVFYGALAVLCMWVALDPAFSLRGYALPFLSLYYLGALSLGYFSGYFLLVFGTRPVLKAKPISAYVRLVNGLVLLAFGLVALLACVLLAYRSYPQIQMTNGSLFPRKESLLAGTLLQDYADSVTSQAPPIGTVLLSDDLTRLLLAQSALTRIGKARAFTFAHTRSLRAADYHRFLAQTSAHKWPFEPGKEQKEVTEPFLVDLAFDMSATNRLAYLHPSFGYYFEVLQPQFHGLICRLTRYPTNEDLSAPTPTKDLVNENELFWQRRLGSQLARVVEAMAPEKSERELSGLEHLGRKVGLRKQNNVTAMVLGSWYSQALVSWGVQMQRLERLAEAKDHFERARELNPNNIVAQINLTCNHNLQAGSNAVVRVPKSIEDEFGKYPSWEGVLAANGPFDEPTFCYEQGRIFWRGKNYRQAAQEFARVVQLASRNIPSRIWLSSLYLMARMPGPALKLLAEVHQLAGTNGLDSAMQREVLRLEAGAHLAQGDSAGAGIVIQAAIGQAPNDEDLLWEAGNIYLDHKQYTNALAVLDLQLNLRPNHPLALAGKGLIYSRLEAYDQAIPPLTQVIRMQTNSLPYPDLHYQAMAQRALAYLKSGQLDKAQRDYDELHQISPTEPSYHFGLGEVAYKKHDTNSAIRYYQLYLANNPDTNSSDATNVMARLKELKPGLRR